MAVQNWVELSYFNIEMPFRYSFTHKQEVKKDAEQCVQVTFNGMPFHPLIIVGGDVRCLFLCYQWYYVAEAQQQRNKAMKRP